MRDAPSGPAPAFELQPIQAERSSEEDVGVAARELSYPLLRENLEWFIRLRWIAICILGGFGLLDLAAGGRLPLGLRTRADWPLSIAGALLLANPAFILHARLRLIPGLRRRARANLSAQIALDLLLLTVVVHFVGSLETYVSFLYLIHVTLACIFFTRMQSLGVTLLAGLLFIVCVVLENLGAIPPANIFGDPAIEAIRGNAALYVLSTLGICGVAWHLVSRLSTIIRKRDLELAVINRRLLRAREERARHMLRTTHELKAPTAALHANLQLLLKGYCGALPAEAIDVVRRVTARCSRMSKEIQEMVQLANVSMQEEKTLQWAPLDLSKAIEWCLAQEQPLILEHRVTVERGVESATVEAVEEHVRVMFSNLIHNAVTYSNPGGAIRVSCRPLPDGGAEVEFRDEGIGIPAEKLPRIFEEYYRTEEAVRHNPASTGLGLAIVRQVAEIHRIRIRVESREGVGTKFILRFPPDGKIPERRG